MSTFASPTPGLDLTMQNLANSTTIIQAMAYYQQSGGVGPDGVHSPRLKQWKRIGKVAVTLLNNRLIIPQEELKTLSVRLVELEGDWVELESILTRKKTFWGKLKHVLGKSRKIQERLGEFEESAFELDVQVERASARAYVKLAQSGALSPSSGASDASGEYPLASAQSHFSSGESHTGQTTSPSDVATQPFAPDNIGASSGLELRAGSSTSSRNPFADPLDDNSADCDGEGADTVLLLTISDRFPEEGSPST